MGPKFDKENTAKDNNTSKDITIFIVKISSFFFNCSNATVKIRKLSESAQQQI